jgi:predicted enzyme related to lactoylglutathione lyase
VNVPVRVGALTVDCADPHRLAGFWSALLGVSVKEVGGDYAELASIGPEGPALLFLRVPEEKAGKNRLHLDLEVTDVAAAVEEAEVLGATRAEGPLAGPFDWVVMQDPEGNEFCLCPVDLPTDGAEPIPPQPLP